MKPEARVPLESATKAELLELFRFIEQRHLFHRPSIRAELESELKHRRINKLLALSKSLLDEMEVARKAGDHATWRQLNDKEDAVGRKLDKLLGV